MKIGGSSFILETVDRLNFEMIFVKNLKHTQNITKKQPGKPTKIL